MAKVLIIDDEQSICELLTRILKAEHEVKASQDPEEALKLVESYKPDCILLDIKMPKIDGVEVLSRIKALDPKIGAIMITGYGNLQTAMESMKLGAFDYITKPFGLDFVKGLVNRCLEAGKE